MSPHVQIETRALEAFCRRWKIVEISLFGSVLRDDFGPESDVDVLVTFATDARWTLFDYGDMQEELATLFGHPVDLVNRRAVEASPNWIRRRAILESAELLYAA